MASAATGPICSPAPRGAPYSAPKASVPAASASAELPPAPRRVWRRRAGAIPAAHAPWPRRGNRARARGAKRAGGCGPAWRARVYCPRMLLHAATIFLSAFLLFLVQPLLAKQILPWFGGAAIVWTLCLVFFQLVLLLGCAYAH